jgi:trans-aconitate methyltransferase
VTDWRGIWSRRSRPSALDLQHLIEADGYDSGAAKVTAADWQIYAARVGLRAGLGKGDSAYEVGCGAGAFLAALQAAAGLRAVGGCDYSATLLGIAREALPDGQFDQLDAEALPPEPEYDVVVSNGVFHYFPDESYAWRVLTLMSAKARRSVVVLDVPDLAHRDESEAARKAQLPPGEYEAKYAGLMHLYLDQAFFTRFAEEGGFGVEIFESLMPNYAQAPYRFGALIEIR